MEPSQPSRPPNPTSAARGPLQRAAGLVDDVYNRIREDIMSLKIPPDSKVSVDRLARELQVSQTPIREALSMLEANGLVIKQRFVGYCTAPTLNRKQFEELYEIRRLIEPYAARCAAQRMSDKELLEISGLALRMSPEHAADSQTTYTHFAVEDGEFHSLIARGSGNTLIAEALDRLHTHLHIFRLRFHSGVTNEAFTEHSLITRALQQRDSDGAEAAMRSHVQKSYERLVKFTRE
jgi:DNA-binding GntR family transcriptional regulator